MACPVSKNIRKILFWTGVIEPHREGISKEVFTLHRHFEDSFVIGTSQGVGKFSLNERYLSIPCWALPSVRFWARYVEKHFSLSHIVQGMNNYHYLKALGRKPAILTAIAVEDILSMDHYQNVNKIVVECNRDRDKLISHGFDPHKVKVIYPGVDVTNFNHDGLIPPEPFKILFASSPVSLEYMEPRGIRLLLEAAKIKKDVEFILAWRKWGNTLPLLQQWIRELSLSNVKVIYEDIGDMRGLYRNAHATVLPFTTEKLTKSCPNSAIESLAAGRPVLLSDNVGISDVIDQENCGVIFSPHVEGLINSIKEIQNGYRDYQGNTLDCARKFFDQNSFLEHYAKLYRET